MGCMGHCFIGWWLCYLFLSTVTAKEQLTLGSPEDCKNAEFVPGHNLGGEGFDIVKMERKGSYVIDMDVWDLGNGSCKLCNNRYVNKPNQKLPAAVTYWRTLTNCARKVSSKVFESSEALVNDSTSAVSNNWKVGLEVPMVAGVSVGGTHSREATYGMRVSKEDKFSFAKQEVKCSYYSYSIKSSPPMHPEFLQAMKSLPPKYDKHSYQGIIDTFGTHYMTKVDLGGKMRAITSIRVCKASLSGLRDTAVSDCLGVEASGTYNSVTVRAQFQHCQSLKKKMGTSESFSSVFNERQTDIVGGNVNGEDILFSSTSHPNALKEWLDSLKTIPDVVTYSLKPLHLLLNDQHPAKNGLKKAIEVYIQENALKQICSESCKMGTHSNPRDHCVCVCEKSESIMSNCCPTERGLASLKVFNLRAKGLYGDTFSKTDGSVQVIYGEDNRRTEIISENDDPEWKESFTFVPIKLSIANKLTFKVYDEDTYWNSDLLGECITDITVGKKEKNGVCDFKYGQFFYSYIVECEPGLQGPKCEHHRPSPMAFSKANIFTSRNGIYAKDMWKLKAAWNYSNNVL